MPQEFQVLTCCSCQTFQVHQVKKTPKWACKICGQKQSIKKVYARGSSVDCRKHVQKLNMMRGEKQQVAEGRSFATSITENSADRDISFTPTSDLQMNYEPEKQEVLKFPGKNRWERFISQPESDNEDQTLMKSCEVAECTTDHAEFTQARKQNRKAAREKYKQKCSMKGKYTAEHSPGTVLPYSRTSSTHIAHNNTRLEHQELVSQYSTGQILGGNKYSDGTMSFYEPDLQCVDTEKKENLNSSVYKVMPFVDKHNFLSKNIKDDRCLNSDLPTKYIKQCTDTHESESINKPKNTSNVGSVKSSSKWAKFVNDGTSDVDENESDDEQYSDAENILNQKGTLNTGNKQTDVLGFNDIMEAPSLHKHSHGKQPVPHLLTGSLMFHVDKQEDIDDIIDFV